MATKKTVKKVIRVNAIQLSGIRTAFKLTQKDFWEAVHITQSAGSRYENGRPIPKQTEILIRIVFLNQSFDDAMKSVSENYKPIDIKNTIDKKLINLYKTKLGIK